MVIIDTRIDHAYHDTGVTGSDIPGFNRIDIGIGRSTILTCVVHAPKGDKVRIIRSTYGLYHIVRLGILNRWVLTDDLDRLVNIGTRT